MEKTSILEELAKGNLEPLHNNYGQDPEYRRALGRMLELEKEVGNTLGETLDDAGERLYSEYCKAQEELNARLTINAFIQGFRLGMRMAAEVFEGRD